MNKDRMSIRNYIKLLFLQKKQNETYSEDSRFEHDAALYQRK